MVSIATGIIGQFFTPHSLNLDQKSHADSRPRLSGGAQLRKVFDLPDVPDGN
jgi:hypothetical protein